ncbi:putative bifunctional diguanylate cyclase/phosphodiesterase [Pseudooctadecabacter sp.]|uniref:putative bifunctional diguanylate cyclase/phosphodiesterase n=1 Tax=Pseudooctadecabacter sp. TaxID=1966338 RepID=UPI0025D18E21|nr:EAL domain-containing protein [Pseudooctadecabacter sp.]
MQNHTFGIWHVTNSTIIFFSTFGAVLLCGAAVFHLFAQNRMLRQRMGAIQDHTSDILRDLTHLRLCVENTSDGILLQDLKGRILWCNNAYCDIMKVLRSDIIGRNPLEFALPDNARLPPEVIEAFEYDKSDEQLKKLQLFRNQRGDGSLFWNQLSVAFQTGSDGRDYAILICRDVSTQVEREHYLEDLSGRLEHEATHDNLTGVPNRAAFLDFIETALKEDRDGSVGLLHVDLDNFKTINDTHGHSAGDAVLRHTAQTIRSSLRKSDLVARIGGDEFVVVCLGSESLDYLEAVGQRLLDALSTPLTWSDRSLLSEASIGAAQSEAGCMNAEDLLNKADFALYEAKRSGRGCIELYDAALHNRHAIEMQLAADLAEAIDTGAIDFWFQPIKNLWNDQIVGFETLARWVHPDTGRVYSPAEFLPVVEDIGLLGELDMISMLTALEKKASLAASGFPDMRMSFNASPELLAHPDFINRLIWAVEASNLDRHQITIEVLETNNFGDAAETSSQGAIIRDLKQAGFRVFLDDFGVGFAGLSHLATLDLSGVKIDRSLVSCILTDDVSFKIVRKAIELCNDLSIAIVAEGVEDETTAKTLQKMGCSLIQGYWVSRPLPASDVVPWLAEDSAPRVRIS